MTPTERSLESVAPGDVMEADAEARRGNLLPQMRIGSDGPAARSVRERVERVKARSRPTLGDSIVAAHRAVDEAVEARNKAIREALDRGATLRQVAAVLPVSFNTVKRWAEASGPSEKRNPLEEPADA